MDLEQGLEHLVDTNNTRAALRMKGTDEMTKIYSVQEAVELQRSLLARIPSTKRPAPLLCRC